jgi:tetratricopeptide (TPR) repeat protein
MPATQCVAEQAVTAAEAGHYEVAVKLFSAAIQSDEHNSALHEQQAQCYMEMCQYNAAAEAAARATALKPAVSCAVRLCMPGVRQPSQDINNHGWCCVGCGGQQRHIMSADVIQLCCIIM